MLKRYARPEMAELWTELKKKQNWHEVEAAVIAAREILGEIPEGTREMVIAVAVTAELLKRADEIELETDHDLIAFVWAVSEQLSEEAKRYYHDRLTSFDTEDTALAITLVLALDLIIEALEKLCEVCRRRAVEHRRTLQVGRTHFMHAKPIVFGLWFLNQLDDYEQHLKRLEALYDEIGVGKISGATGSFSLSPQVEDLACKYLKLKAARISTQVISRALHTRYGSELADLAVTLKKYATDIRLLAGTDLSEVGEYKPPKAKGSSAMPGKSLLGNTIKSENVCSLAHVMEGFSVTARKCQVIWLQRTLDNSAAERVWIPDASTYAHFMILRFSDVLDKLVVYPDQMLANLNRTGGLVYAEDILGELTKYLPRPVAYDILERLAKQLQRGTYRTTEGKTFRELVYDKDTIAGLLTVEQLDQLFDPWNSLKYINDSYARFGL